MWNFSLSGFLGFLRNVLENFNGFIGSIGG